MTTKSIVVFVAAIVAVVSAGMAWRANHQTQAARQTLTVATSEWTRLEAAARRTEEQITTAERSRAEIQSALDAAKAVRATPNAPPPAARPTPRPGGAQNEPAAQAAAVKRFKAGLLLRYGSFYRALGLTPEQIAKFEDLLSDQEGRRRDLSATAAAQGLPPSDPAIATLRRENTERFKAEQIALLGEDGYARLEDFNRGESRRRVVQQLVSELALSPTPLSAPQARQLDATFAEFGFKGSADRGQWDAILARAQNFLSPVQVAELQAGTTQSQRQVAMEELDRMIEKTKK